MNDDIKPGDLLRVRDAAGDYHEMEALSGVEVTGHKFPIVWVNCPRYAGGFSPMPWPVEAVDPAAIAAAAAEMSEDDQAALAARLAELAEADG
jgi:hypothetical protein